MFETRLTKLTLANIVITSTENQADEHCLLFVKVYSACACARVCVFNEHRQSFTV